MPLSLRLGDRLTVTIRAHDPQNRSRPRRDYPLGAGAAQREKWVVGPKLGGGFACEPRSKWEVGSGGSGKCDPTFENLLRDNHPQAGVELGGQTGAQRSLAPDQCGGDGACPLGAHPEQGFSRPTADAGRFRLPGNDGGVDAPQMPGVGLSRQGINQVKRDGSVGTSRVSRLPGVLRIPPPWDIGTCSSSVLCDVACLWVALSAPSPSSRSNSLNNDWLRQVVR